MKIDSQSIPDVSTGDTVKQIADRSSLRRDRAQPGDHPALRHILGQGKSRADARTETGKQLSFPQVYHEIGSDVLRLGTAVRGNNLQLIGGLISG